MLRSVGYGVFRAPLQPENYELKYELMPKLVSEIDEMLRVFLKQFEPFGPNRHLFFTVKILDM
jgi:hypothetical protein